MQLEDNLGVEEEDMGVGHIDMVEEDIQQRVGALADQTVSFAEPEELPSVQDQTYHLSCPSQSCAVSAYRHKPSSRPYQTSKIVTGKPPESHHFQQSLRL